MRAAVCGGRPKSLTLLATDGTDLGPLVEAAAQQHGVPVALLAAMLRAESGLSVRAERWGIHTAAAREALAAGDMEALEVIIADAQPDLSFGLAQLIVSTAGGYGVGDGSMNVANVLAVRQALFDPAVSIGLGARHLAGCMIGSEHYAEPRLQILLRYNSGSFQSPGNWYWQRWAGNVAAYRSALAWAQSVVGGMS